MTQTPAEMNQTPQRPTLLSRAPSLIWLVPILALIVTLGVAWNAVASRGTLIQIEFADATGITPGETTLKFREITVGKVESVNFTNDLTKVVVSVRVERDLAQYIDSNAQFWIVRPQVSAQGISRLDTVLSGVFIEGFWTADHKGEPKTRFVGLSKPPLTTRDARGTWVVLHAATAQDLTEGAPVLFRGLRVGRVQNLRLSNDDEGVMADAFIEAPYDQRLTSKTSFWDASGFSLSLGAQGLAFNVRSMASLLQGGIEFDTLTSGGTPIEAGHVFALSKDQHSVRNDLLAESFQGRLRVSILLDENVRGLNKGAEVQYQGLPVGMVTDIGVVIGDGTEGADAEAPVRQKVTLALSPEKLGLPFDISTQDALTYLGRRVADEGLRARLASTGLLGNTLIVELLPVADAPAAALDEGAKPYPIMPVTASNVSDMAENAKGVLGQISDLPLADTLRSAQAMFDSVTVLASQDSTRAVPAEAAQALAEAKAAIAQINQVVSDLNASGAGKSIGPMVEEAQAAFEGVKTAAKDIPDTVDKIQSVVEKIDRVDFDAISAQAEGILRDVRAMLGSEDAAQLPRNLSDTLKAASGLLNDLRDGNAAGSLNAALASARKAADQVAISVARLPAVMDQANKVLSSYGDRSAFNAQMIQTMRELERATAAFGSLARTIERNPRAFIFGR